MQINWTLISFETLNPLQLHAILQLRSRVFVVEQQCVYLDADGKDPLSLHFCGWDGDILAAYTRLVPAGVSYPEYPSIGRVVIAPEYRGLQLGRILMQQSIACCREKFGHTAIKIGAQLCLENFYTSLGFCQTSPVYLEDNIKHIEMVFYPG